MTIRPKIKRGGQAGEIARKTPFPPDYNADRMLISKTEALDLVESMYEGDSPCFDMSFGDLVINYEVSRARAAKHHVWCNSPDGDPKTCKMCKGLRKSYPYNNLDEDTLVREHFNVI